MRVTTLIELDRRQEALAAAEEAALRQPSNREVLLALGFAYQKGHRPHDALRCYQQALAMGEPDAELLNNYGIVLQDLGRPQEALESYDRALARDPQHILARFHRALAQLLIGNYAAGWPDYEARLVSAQAPRGATRPRWQGGDAARMTLLAYGEQGLGDEIMFASCLPDLIRCAGHVVVECSPRLHGLFARAFPAATVRAAGSPAGPETPRDLQIDAEVPTGSLPLYFRGSRSAFPRHGGYLHADPKRVAVWRDKLDALGPAMKIGLSWRGGTYATRSPLRSIDLDRLLPLLKLPNVHFVSLQYTAEALSEIQALEAEHAIQVTHWPEAIADYEETAALVSALDLTITVCTAIVHLAGALGRPVWVAAPRSPEWRYGFSGEEMPWYPSARVLRQDAHGEWDGVVGELARRLRAVLCEDTTLERPLS
ncbi:MAG: tetratricopeptide repeat protein [Burkholderiales bacterium]